MDAPARAPAIRLRPVTAADREFLQLVYASTRADELAVTAWTDEQKAAFCQHQFEAQDRHYREHYPGAELSVVECGDTPIGRLYVARWPNEIRIMDIALLPEHRGAGIGTHYLRQMQEEARAAGKPLSIHVERFSPALRLYQRLGLTLREEVGGVYLLLEWRPGDDRPRL